MSELRNWVRVVSWVLRYFLYRIGMGARPEMKPYYPDAMVVVGRLCGWPHRIRIVGAENCPKHGPAAFAGNHLKFDDPPIMFRAIYLASGGVINAHFLGRDDIFADAPFARLVDYNDILDLTGGVLFTRESVRLAQLKPVIRLLQQGECCALYPARTRSRTGVVMELPEGHEEPGGLSLFVAQAQRNGSARQIPVVPLTRTFNPVNGRNAFLFGAPEFLPGDATREERFAFDCTMVVRIANLIELNTPQILAAILCIRALHHRDGAISLEALTGAVRRVVDAAPHPHIDPAIAADLPGEMRATLRHFAAKRMLRLHGGTILPDGDAIRRNPDCDYHYRDNNILKYLANQILHLTRVIAAAEDAALSLP